MANSVDPNQTAPSGAVWSGSALFAHAILSDTLVYESLWHLQYNKLVWRAWKLKNEVPHLTASKVCKLVRTFTFM